MKYNRANRSTKFGTTKLLLALGMALFFNLPTQAMPSTDVKIPDNVPDFSIDEGLAFMKTPQYKKEFSKAISEAKKACSKHLGKTNLAIVSDIDETVLNNKEYFEKNKDWEEWDKWMTQSNAPVLKPTVEFLSWARKNGFAIFFITGRREEDRFVTIRNLVKTGIVYDGLYMRGNDDNTRAELMKSKYRKQIEDMGFKIIVSIGDQYSDLAGGYAEDCQKLPNKIYFIK